MEPDVDLLNLRREQKSHEELILRAENELAQLLLPRDKERLEIQRLKDDIAQKKGSEEDLLGFEEELRRKREDFEKGSKTAETLQFQIDNSKSQIKICERMIADGERRVYLQANFNVRMGPGNPSYKSHYYRLKNRPSTWTFEDGFYYEASKRNSSTTAISGDIITSSRERSVGCLILANDSKSALAIPLKSYRPGTMPKAEDFVRIPLADVLLFEPKTKEASWFVGERIELLKQLGPELFEEPDPGKLEVKSEMELPKDQEKEKAAKGKGEEKEGQSLKGGEQPFLSDLKDEFKSFSQTLSALSKSSASTGTKLSTMDSKLSTMDTKLTKVDRKTANMSTKLNQTNKDLKSVKFEVETLKSTKREREKEAEEDEESAGEDQDEHEVIVVKKPGKKRKKEEEEEEKKYSPPAKKFKAQEYEQHGHHKEGGREHHDPKGKPARKPSPRSPRSSSSSGDSVKSRIYETGMSSSEESEKHKAKEHAGASKHHQSESHFSHHGSHTHR